MTARLTIAGPRTRVAYAAWSDAGADGLFRLTLPVPTDYRGGNLATDPVYRVSRDGDSSTVSVPESAVRSGEAIALPDSGPLAVDRSRALE